MSLLAILSMIHRVAFDSWKFFVFPKLRLLKRLTCGFNHYLSVPNAPLGWAVAANAFVFMEFTVVVASCSLPVVHSSS